MLVSVLGRLKGKDYTKDKEVIHAVNCAVAGFVGGSAAAVNRLIVDHLIGAYAVSLIGIVVKSYGESSNSLNWQNVGRGILVGAICSPFGVVGAKVTAGLGGTTSAGAVLAGTVTGVATSVIALGAIVAGVGLGLTAYNKYSKTPPPSVEKDKKA